MQICTNCRGLKKVMGMGWMEKTCDTCLGTGIAKETLNFSTDEYSENDALQKTALTEALEKKEEKRKLRRR